MNMTIKELIEKLKQYPEDYYVMVNGYEGGYNFASSPEECDMRLDVHHESYYGKHEKDDSSEINFDKNKNEYKKVKAIII